MLLVDDILFFPVHGEATSITEQLRILYMQLETGRITEAEFEAGEKVLLDRLDLIESRMDDESNTEESDDDEAEESDRQGGSPARR
jgi:hypothetical protein